MSFRVGRRFVPSSTILRRMQALDDRYARELRARQPNLFLRSEVVPFVEVTIVRAPEAVGPVVDVALEPVKIDDGAK